MNLRYSFKNIPIVSKYDYLLKLLGKMKDLLVENHF